MTIDKECKNLKQLKLLGYVSFEYCSLRYFTVAAFKRLLLVRSIAYRITLSVHILSFHCTTFLPFLTFISLHGFVHPPSIHMTSTSLSPTSDTFPSHGASSALELLTATMWPTLRPGRLEACVKDNDTMIYNTSRVHVNHKAEPQ